MLTATVSPALDHIIERPRLIARIVEGNGRVTVFAAPAGYGKTTLARQWAERQTGPVAWYRTNRASGDIAVLSVGLDEALASIAPELPRDPGRVARIASVNPSPRPLGRALVQTYEPLTKDVLLIVDEWEAAGTEEAEQLLSTLVDQLKIRFLITSRTRPEWFTPRLEVYGEGVEIGVDELTMTDEEAADVLSTSNAARGRARLLRTAEGWPAVVGLAAMSRQVDITPEQLMSRTLYDYLAKELLESATGRTQDGLLLLATANIRNLDRARTLLGRNADEVMREAITRGLIATDGRGAISLHPLLRDLLGDRFRRAEGDSRIALLTQCRMLIAHKLWDEALLVAETVADTDFVREAISAALDDLLAAGRTSTLRRWVTAARSAEADSAIIDYAESETLLRLGDFDRSLVLARKATSALKGDLIGRAHLVAARAAHLGNRPLDRDRHLELAETFADDTRTSTDLHWLKFAAAVTQERPEVHAILERFEQFEQIAGNTYDSQLRVAEAHILIAMTQGSLDERMSRAELNLSVFESAHDPYAKTSLLNIYSNALSAQGRYEEALAAANRELAFAEEYGLEFVSHYGNINKARALTGLRLFADSKRVLDEVARRLRAYPDPYVACQHSTYLAALYLSLGDAARAVDVLVTGIDERAGTGLHAEFRAMNALALSATGDFGRAHAQALQARSLSDAAEMNGLLAAAQAVKAAVDEDAPAIISASQAILELGTGDALVLAWRIAPQVARTLLTAPDLQERVIRLMIASRDQAVARQAGVRIPRDARPAGVLSPREREVYELVAQGLTNDEIAKLLYISLSTTKVHVRHILEKLAVRSRLEATRAWYDEQAATPRPSKDPSVDPPDLIGQ